MNKQKSRPWLPLLLIAVALVTAPPPVMAYLDPSTGSMVVSAIVGIFASIALALKTYWYRIKGLFRREEEKETAGQDGTE